VGHGGRLLLITEAGGMVSDLYGSDTYLDSGYICAGNANIHPLLLQVIAPHLPPALSGHPTKPVK